MFEFLGIKREGLASKQKPFVKGSFYLESGYVYAPYIPLMLTPTIYDQKKRVFYT